MKSGQAESRDRETGTAVPPVVLSGAAQSVQNRLRKVPDNVILSIKQEVTNGL